MRNFTPLSLMILFVIGGTLGHQNLELLASSIPGDISEDASNSKGNACENHSDYRAQQCCLRSERIKDLQQEEFAIPNPNDENETLFDLQQKYDKALAQLKIHEGVQTLQDDYLKFMRRLENPEESGNALSELSRLKRLEDDSREAIDRAYRMQFIHEAMDELKSKDGVFTDESGKSSSAGQLYDRAHQNCQESKRTDKICALLNPESEFNKKAGFWGKVSSREMKKMMSNYLKAYGVATEDLSKEEKLKHHEQFETALQKIPRSVLKNQIKTYDKNQKKLNELFSKKDNKDLKELYSCIKKVRYSAQDNQCNSSIATDRLQYNIREITNKASNQAREIVNTGFGKLISDNEKRIINESLSAQTIAEFEKMTVENNKNLTEAEEKSFQNVLTSVEQKLKLAANISNRRGEKSLEGFFSEYEETDHLPKIKSELMAKLCKSQNVEYKPAGILKCLENTNKADRKKSEELIAQQQNDLEKLKQSIDGIMSSDKYKQINSFKNYYAHQSKKECENTESTGGEFKYTGDCHIDFGSEIKPVARLTGDTEKVIAEVQYRVNGGPERGIEELSSMHEFCYNLEEDKRKTYEVECRHVQQNYKQMTTDHSEIDQETKDYLKENMSVYDPETGEISYQKRESTWGMLGISSARAIASSVPNFMQYQYTKSTLPFLRDQAIYRKTYQHWANQQFSANFFQPGNNFNPFAAGGGFGYGISPINNFPSFGGRTPIGSPQGLNIP